MAYYVGMKNEDTVKIKTARGEITGTITRIEDDPTADGGKMVTIQPEDGSKPYRRAINFGIEVVR